jgi:hypothetical protein
MTDLNTLALPAASALTLTDELDIVQDVATVPVDNHAPLSAVKTLLDHNTIHRVCGTVSNPQAVYGQRAQIVLFRAPADLTITRIHIHGSDTTPTAELAGDLKFATDINVGGFAGATVIDVCDTTNGVKTITAGFDDATVPADKYIYFQMDSSPHADWLDFYIEFYYTLD